MNCIVQAKGVDGNMSEQESEKRDETLKREEVLESLLKIIHLIRCTSRPTSQLI